MKSTNIYNLRASVEHEVWSSTKGANKVLQNAWEVRKPGEKIIFIFSITHRYGVCVSIGEEYLTDLFCSHVSYLFRSIIAFFFISEGRRPSPRPETCLLTL